MCDAEGCVLGIQLRFPNGRKLAAKGGREGLFLPRGLPPQSPLLIAEGSTDAAALLDLGFSNVVGRPSCRGGIKLLVALVRKRRRPEVVIAADGDEPGRRGAESLASVLMLFAPSVRVIRPPEGIKDVRAWLRTGGTREDVQQAITAATARRLVIQARSAAEEVGGR
jgi:DNA primase